MKITKDTFIISDTHFHHKTVTKFEPSRAEATADGNYENQDEMLIDNWNKVVGPNDDVLILGDYAWKGRKEITRRLNGNKTLIRGNHDKSGDHAYISAGFVMVVNGVHYDAYNDTSWVFDNGDPYISAKIMELQGQRILFSHYPVDFYEDYYAEQRRQDLTGIVKTLSDTVRPMGCTMNIHGHTHSKMVPDTDTMRYVNVCCENIAFTPIRLGDLLEAVGC